MKKLRVILFITMSFILFHSYHSIAKSKNRFSNNQSDARYEKHTGIIVRFQNPTISLYETTDNMEAEYKIDKNCRIIFPGREMYYESSPRIYNYARLLKKGYRVKILVDPKDNLVKIIYIEEMPK